MAFIKKIWMDENYIYNGLRVGAIDFCFCKIPLHEIVSIQYVVYCIGSSQGFGPFIEVTCEGKRRKKIQFKLCSDAKPDIDLLYRILCKSGRDCADPMTIAAVDHGPRMLIDGKNLIFE